MADASGIARGEPSVVRTNAGHHPLRGRLLRGRIWRCATVARPVNPATRQLSANESVPSCILALVLIYAIGAEWLGSVAGITGAYLLGYVFARSKFKADVERSFYAIGHGLLIPLFFLSIGLSSDYRALSGHWGLLPAVLVVAIVSKIFGCGLAALASDMGWVRACESVAG